MVSTSTEHPSIRRPLSRSRKLCYSLIATALAALLLEGASSTAVVVYKMVTAPRLAERLHTEYDPQLGWINKADFSGRHLYGPDRHLHTNAQRFRDTEPLFKAAPANRVRVVCSGDSFTLGYGVGDPDTWCVQLEKCDARLQTVNLGQGGYGVDQAYLWYQRVEPHYEHAIHLFAFITEDFRRMANDTFVGYGKPVLSLEGDRLRTGNVPVPRTAYRLASLVRNGNLLSELNSVRVARRLLWGKPHVPTAPEVDANSRRVAPRIFAELARQHERNGRLFVLVHLPTKADLLRRSSTWREFLSRLANENGWNYWYLGDELAALPRDEIEALFLGNEVPYLAAAGHYSAPGNRRIATALYARLADHPDVRRRLQAAQQHGSN
ncbi:MAG: hypothetical protein CMJ59_15110 [Planctomycetaceae bacterium]|nr:hypothetical protein [Planctomycetaceae bacterium]